MDTPGPLKEKGLKSCRLARRFLVKDSSPAEAGQDLLCKALEARPALEDAKALVVGPEIMPPLTNTMRFIHSNSVLHTFDD